MSQKALNRPLRHQTRIAQYLHGGLSVYKTERDTRNLASASPHLGVAIARLSIPMTLNVRVELDTGKYGHCTIWGDAGDLWNHVADIVPI